MWRPTRGVVCFARLQPTPDQEHESNQMRAYIATTGIIFALIVAAHIARGFAEGREIYTPSYIALTLVCALLSIWSLTLLRNSRSQQRH